MEPTPIPVRKVTIVSLILFANNASIWMIFSFLPFMVVYYYPHTDPTEIGYLAGILGSAFSLGSLCGNFLWGILADQFGRRVVLLSGLVGTAFSAALFGLSPNFWTAVFARFLWGLLNGNIGVGKTYMAEIHDDSNSAKGMAIFGVIGGLGRTVGPFIGGFLAQPADHYSIFKGTIFETFPFALPSIIIVILCLVVFVVAYFELTETLTSYSPLMRNEEEDDEDMEKSNHRLLNIDDSSSGENNNNTTLSHHDNERSGGDIEMGGMGLYKTLNKYLAPAAPDYMHLPDSELPPFSSSSTSSSSLSSSSSPSHSSHEQSHDQEQDQDQEQVNPKTKIKKSKTKKSLTFNGIVEKQNLETGECEYAPLNILEYNKNNETNESNENNNEEEEEEDDLANGFKSKHFYQPIFKLTNGSELITPEVEKEYYSSYWKQTRYFLRTKMIVVSILIYGLLSLVHVIAVEVFPLWLVLPRDNGGFGFSSNQIGLIITITGPINILSQLFVYPSLVERYGPLQVFRYGIFLYVLCAFLLPFCTKGILHEMKLISIVFVTIGNSLLTSVAGWCFISVFVFINNSCYSHQRGKVNGLGQSFASLGRLIGPICGSSLFAWTAHRSQWPLNYSFIWYVIAGGAICIWKLSSRLPKKIVKRRREPTVPRYALSMMKNDDL